MAGTAIERSWKPRLERIGARRKPWWGSWGGGASDPAADETRREAAKRARRPTTEASRKGKLDKQWRREGIYSISAGEGGRVVALDSCTKTVHPYSLDGFY